MATKELSKADLEIYGEFLRELSKESFTIDSDWIVVDSDNRQSYKRINRYTVEFKEWQPVWSIIEDFDNEDEVNTKGYYYQDKINILEDVTPHYLWEEVKAYYNSFKELWEEIVQKDAGSFLVIVLECYWEQQYMKGKY